MKLQPAPLGILLLAAAVAAATLVCTLPGIPDPTSVPRPTYTPYPTFTPAPEPTPEPLATIPLTVQPFSRYFSHLQPATPVAVLPEATIAPTLDPSTLVVDPHSGEWFFGLTRQYVAQADALMFQAQYREAIEQFTKAQQAHGNPSAVLQNNIGTAYAFLGEHQQAIAHLTNAISIEDNPRYRKARASSYAANNQCDLAINDANAALSMPPMSAPGWHTDAEAHGVLSNCYFAQSDHTNALKHLQDYASIAKDNQYLPDVIASFYTGAAWWAYEHKEFAYAIKATSQAIQIHDSAEPRALRASSYTGNQNCPLAVEDAKHTLALQPYQEPGFHTDVTANSVLAWCYSEAQQHIAALQHAEAALAIARLHQHPPDHIQTYSDMVQSIRDELSP